MSTSFLDYAMSVIVSRALPDVRDGLKPVHRRILYSMEENGIRAGTPFKKSAQVVGDVMGKYHPHGDGAIYDALVRLGQDFSSRYPLIEPQGNFGTVDDPPAAYRYTECRLESLSTHMLEGINEDTVNFIENYSGEYLQPEVLPGRFPNLLVNGSTGIAVGMATNIPPHNLGEVVDACIHMLDNPKATTEDLMEFVKGPDFPTGGYIVGTDGIRDALMTGRGSIKIRAVTDVDEVRKGRTGIIVTEIPYQTGHDRIMTKIAELVHAKRIEGIADLRDESSSRVGTRLVIELKRDARAQVVLNQLYKLTPLQDTFGVNFVALVDGIPRTLGLSDSIKHYLDHQMEVVERRTAFRLQKAEDRAHILEGLVTAVDNIDEVVKLIRASADVETARAGLMKTFKLTEIQANHILDMPLRRLTALESEKLREEFAALQKTIKALQAILKSPAKRRKLIAKELSDIREKFADHRRTRIVPDEGDFSMEDLIADEELVVTVSQAGYVKSVVANTYRAQGRGGRGVQGAKLGEDDVVTRLLHTTAHSYLLFFTNRGKVYRIRAHEIPRKERTAKGTLAQAFMQIEPDERIEAVVDTRDYETSQFLVIATRKGQVKKTKFSEYDSRQASLIAIRLADDDEVVAVRTTSGEADLLLFTHNGQGIRFAESDIRAMGRSTQGVRGIKLREGDYVVSAAQDGEGDEVLLLTDAGYGKRTKMDQFPKQKRGGLGVKAIKITPSRGHLIGARAFSPGSQLFATSSDGIVMRTEGGSVSRQKRDASGVKVMNLEEGASLTAFTVVSPDEEA
ncbi:MAG: DNA gyrase subunit A [Acidimicrobiia bacterium]|nr:DNA gyrase subunit A [Acidimicrobiia bacterium]MBT8248097.1 DNA gyrase subunit A [Acidimicrobiia bacterium]NNF87748.1 DNA gyrase subunit A [Acidimicrobiia bacterium]NNL12380.1 DNA gyrase subunit A [Acidimicrobiia bacterium]RZV47766.1 MAG: DNA gyrase subunit A [Acidimicrobiia bacterium]